MTASKNANGVPDMTLESDHQPDARISPPDYTLRTKVGGKLDQLITPQSVQAAEQVIVETADLFLKEGLAQTEALERANAALQRDPSTKDRTLPLIIESAFSIKTKVISSGYDLASALAKSLHVLCEAMLKRELTPKDLELIQWHVTSLRLLLRGGLKGDGGPTGAAILEQLQLIAPPGVLIM